MQECYGHRSRIWKVNQCGSDSDGNRMLVTASEDATCKLWPMAKIDV